MMRKLFVASATLLLLASTSMDASARRVGVYRSSGRNSITGPNRNYMRGLGLRKQTRTGGPAGGQTNGGGGS